MSAWGSADNNFFGRLMSETEAMKTRAGELRTEIRQLKGEREDADVRRACQMFGAEEEIADLDRRIAALEAKHRELQGRAQVLVNEEQVAADERRREEARRVDEAVRYTQGIEREFRRLLAETGWYLASAGEGRERCEQRALGAINAGYGEGAVEHCRKHVLPALSPAASAGAGGR